MYIYIYMQFLNSAGVRAFAISYKVVTRCNRPEYAPGRSIPGYIIA